MIDPAAIAALLQLGLAGVGLYLFVKGVIITKAAADELVLLVKNLYEALIEQHSSRYAELRKDRDEWKALALGSERRLDKALPTVATAIGAAVPSTEPAPPEAGP